MFFIGLYPRHPVAGKVIGEQPLRPEHPRQHTGAEIGFAVLVGRAQCTYEAACGEQVVAHGGVGAGGIAGHGRRLPARVGGCGRACGCWKSWTPSWPYCEKPSGKASTAGRPNLSIFVDYISAREGELKRG